MRQSLDKEEQEFKMKFVAKTDRDLKRGSSCFTRFKDGCEWSKYTLFD